MTSVDLVKSKFKEFPRWRRVYVSCGQNMTSLVRYWLSE